MQLISKCSRAYGHVRVRETRSNVELYKNVLYDRKGLYNWQRRLIPDAGHFQGVRFPNRPIDEPYQPRTTEVEPGRVLNEGADDIYIWGGYLTSHYGHFLLDTLSRLMIVQNMPYPRPKVVFWTRESLYHCLSQPFCKLIFDFIGLKATDIVVFDQPTLLRNVLIQAPGFECNSYVHTEFSNFCERIGWAIASTPESLDQQPIYFSKHLLRSGVARLQNEIIIAERLEKAGVKVISPETLSFEDQVGLWVRHATITGYLGSAMHTAIFSRDKTTACLNHESQVYSNQIMIDQSSKHRSQYYSLAGNLEALGAADGFQLNFRMPNPDAVADEWLKIIDGLSSRNCNLQSSFYGFSIDDRAYIDEPFGKNLSRGRNADQSSIFPPHSMGKTTIEDAARAVDGLRHPQYAFHTQEEVDPWWQVDLSKPCIIHEVRIFNRLDIGNEHSRNFRILFSSDNKHFTVAYVCHGEPFGLPDGKPYRWLCDRNYVARFVRIQLIGEHYLHLLQVEIFGEMVPSDGDQLN